MSTVNDTDLLAALNTGLESAGTAPSEPAEETTDETVDEASAAGAGEGAADDAADTGEGGDDAGTGGVDGESAAGEGDDAAGAKGGEDGSDATQKKDPVTGKFLPKKAAKPADGDGAALGPDGKPVAKAAAAAKDPVNDPIPQGLKKETQERMVSLIDTAKKLTTERDTAVSQRDEILGMITETRSTPEQYGQALDYLRAVNSGDPADLDRCIAFMQTELAALCKLRGKPVAGVDLLAEHADLTQEVADGAITRQRAEEIAAARGHHQVRTSQATAAQQQQAARQAITQGKTDLNALEAELMANDPHFAHKRALLVPALQGTFAQIDPRRWRETFKAAYDRIPNPAVAAKPTPPTNGGAKVPQNQPLRAKNPAGGQQAAPKSLLDAVSQGIANAR